LEFEKLSKNRKSRLSNGFIDFRSIKLTQNYQGLDTSGHR
jgi:hypothetical protein